MAETMNYRMNLVIDPKNVIKANRELRAMERYFERIQGRVLRIGRTRMAPEIVLKDRASKGLDNLLRKLQRVRSEVINASGTVTLKVKHEQAKQKHDNKGTQEQNKGKKIALKAPPMPKIVLVFPDFTPIIRAMNVNSLASVLNSRLLNANSGHLSDLAKALGSIQIGGASGAKEEEKPQSKSLWEKIKSGVGFTKNTVAMAKGIKDTRENWEGFKGAWGTTKPTNGTTKKEKIAEFGKKLWTNKKEITKKSIDFISPITETLEAGTGVADSIAGLFSGGGSSSATSDIVSKSASEVAGSGSGILGKMLKGGLKRSLGVASVAMDAVSIANAKPGKERAEAIGSAAGGTIGSVLGGAVGSLIPIPVVGTAIGSAVGGAVGDFVGGKIGGFIADSAPKIKETFTGVSNWFSKNILGKKDKPKDKEDVSKKPDVIKTPAVPEKQPLLPPAPLMQRPTLPPYPPSSPYYQSYQMGMGMNSPQNMSMVGPGPRMQSAVTNNATSAVGKLPQVVQISPEQMTTLSGFLRDMKTETTTQYNLPPGAVQVTVHEEYPVDVEGIIQQVGQRLRAEFAKATQNRKPQSMALA